jgi:hypothetical protein|mmetsp:Transcript_14202/g.40535  ORF Transcript_14202/g.40535 Transcript_14202/m.40535 type:complete len:106 (+) Transcript_14202:5855-6172(+)
MAGFQHGDTLSKEEYDQLVQSYYLARSQHQTEMLRLNQILYLGGGNRHQQPQPSSERPARPALQGINGNMQIDAHPDAHPDALEFPRKRVHAGKVEEENKRIRPV